MVKYLFIAVLVQVMLAQSKLVFNSKNEWFAKD